MRSPLSELFYRGIRISIGSPLPSCGLVDFMLRLEGLAPVVCFAATVFADVAEGRARAAQLESCFGDGRWRGCCGKVGLS